MHAVSRRPRFSKGRDRRAAQGRARPRKGHIAVRLPARTRRDQPVSSASMSSDDASASAPLSPRLLRVSAALVLFLGGAALGAWADQLADVPRPPPGPATVLGGFAPLVAQASMVRADAALRERRESDALLLFEVARELDPGSVPLAADVAHQLAFGLGGPGRPAPARWAYHAAALRSLDAAVEHSPSSARARFERGRLAYERIGRDADLASRFVEHRGSAPLVAAADDFREAARLDPDDLLSAQYHALAAVLHAANRYEERTSVGLSDARAWAARGDRAFTELAERIEAEGALEDWPGAPLMAASRAFRALVDGDDRSRAELEAAFRAEFGEILPLAE